MTNPELAILMLGSFIFIILLGFPIAFTLMAMGVGFGYYAYFTPDQAPSSGGLDVSFDLYGYVAPTAGGSADARR